MAKHRLPNSARVVLHMDGLCVTTTMGEIRRGSVSSCIAQLAADFDGARKVYADTGRPLCSGFGSRYLDGQEQSRNLQISIA